MKKFWLLLIGVVIVVSLVGCTTGFPSGVVRGSGKSETRDFQLAGFTGIQAGNAFSIQVSREDSFKVQVTADDNLWDSLDISVSGTELHLQARPGVSVINSTLKAVVTLPQVSSLDVSGAANASIGGFNSDNGMTFTISGAGAVKIDDMKSGDTVFEISGAGNASGKISTAGIRFSASGGSRTDLSGTGTDGNIEASGGSRVTLDQFQLQKVSVTLSGGAEGRVNAQNITSADLSGGSNLFYVGSPTLGKVQTSGGSSIRPE